MALLDEFESHRHSFVFRILFYLFFFFSVLFTIARTVYCLYIAFIYLVREGRDNYEFRSRFLYTHINEYINPLLFTIVQYLNSAHQRNYMLCRIIWFWDLGFRSYYFVIIFNEFDMTVRTTNVIQHRNSQKT